MIDLRSDTVTRPTDEMRRVIAEAEVGDDVFHDDPMVLALEERVADVLGKEDAVYVPSGTMSNQVAIRAHTRPGDVVIAAELAHINIHEMGAPAALAGVTVRELPSKRGMFTPEAVHEAIPVVPPSMPSSLFEPVTLLECENTHNAAGGTIWPLDQLGAVVAAAKEHGLGTHLDGARLWNAAVATGVPERDFAEGFDTVSVCFSKGLGAPMGSALAGRRELIETARRFKQMHGGGFRQAGMMAAAALYAVENHRERLAEDHGNARRLALGLSETPGVAVDLASVETNMVYFETTMPADRMCEEALSAGVAMLPAGPHQVRAVMNLHVAHADVDTALDVIGSIAGA
jgi:threonine aldolase